jgi:tetratricopeptide (TPR) repeat protein
LAPYFLVQQAKDEVKKSYTFIPSLYFVLALILVIPSIYIANQVYASFKIQKFVMGEINANPVYSTKEVIKLPNIPNLSTSALPIKALIARYYIRDKNFPAAIKLLKESDNDNPYIHYNDFLLTSVYASQNNFDSTLVYAKRAFYNWPRATSYYKNMVFAAVRKKDTIELNKAFDTSLKYSNTALTYEEYVKGSFELKSKTTAQLNALLDIAVKKFPKENLSNTRALINGGIIASNPFALAGNQNFQKKNYTAAFEDYKKAIAAEPTNFAHYENAGLSLFYAKNYKDCIYYFEKAASFQQNNSGKPQYFLGVSNINLGNKEKGCVFLNTSKSKGYTEAAATIKSVCK